jgi:raffinose/stachyose/melibiose transport system substrate-binding protein
MRANRIVIWIATLMLVLSVVVSGCGPTATPAPAEPTKAPAEPTKAPEAATPTEAAPEEKVTITFWHIYGPEMGGANAWFNDMVDEFEASHPNIDVQMEVFANDPYKTKLPTALAAEEAADAFMVYPGGWTEPFARQGRIEPLDQYLDEGGWRDLFVPATFAECTWDENTYCLPFSLRTVHIWYNKELFEQYDLAVPQTIGDLEAVCDTLKANGVTPFALGDKEGHQGWQWFFGLLARVGGYDAYMDLKLNRGDGWNSPGVIETFRILQDWTEKGYFNEGVTALGIMDVNPSFFNGETAMIVNGTYFVDQVKSLAGEDWLEEKLGFFNFPAVPDGKGDMGIYHGGVGSAFVLNSASPHKAEVMEFYRYIFSPEKITDVSGRTNWVMCMKDTLPADASPLLQSLGEEAAKMESYLWYIDHTVPPEMLLTAYPTLQAVFDLSITPEEAAAQMQKAADELVGK